MSYKIMLAILASSVSVSPLSQTKSESRNSTDLADNRARLSNLGTVLAVHETSGSHCQILPFVNQMSDIHETGPAFPQSGKLEETLGLRVDDYTRELIETTVGELPVRKRNEALRFALRNGLTTLRILKAAGANLGDVFTGKAVQS